MKKRRLLLLLCMFLLLPGLILAKDLNLPDPSYEGYVYDGAGVLDQQTKDILVQKGKSLDQETGAQIVVAIIPSLEGNSIEDYSESLFQHWKIGNKQDQGVLLLISMEEHKIRIETGYGLEGVLPDMVCAQIIDEMAPYFRQDDVNGGVLYGFKEIFTKVATEVGYEDKGQDISVPENEEEEDSDFNFGSILRIIIILIILSSLFSGPRGPRGRRRRGGFWIFPGGFGGGWYGGSGGWSGGSGGWSGGGGGGWSGGGGSSGGGGASGGW